MIFDANAKVIRTPILLTDALLIGSGNKTQNVVKWIRVDMFNTNREEVPSFYCYLKSIDPSNNDNYVIKYYTEDYTNIYARMLLLPGKDKDNLDCLCMEDTNRRYGVPKEVKARGWLNYWWER